MRCLEVGVSCLGFSYWLAIPGQNCYFGRAELGILLGLCGLSSRGIYMYQCVIVAIHSKTSEYISVPEFPPLRGNPMYIEYFVVYLFPSFPFSLLVLSFSFFFSLCVCRVILFVVQHSRVRRYILPESFKSPICA